jgi:hypothetical protein
MNTTSSKQQTGHRKRFILVMVILSLVVGLILISINIYGLTQPIRKPGVGVTDHHLLRFIPDKVLTYEESMEKIDALEGIGDRNSLASEATNIVNESLVHVEWKQVDPEEYRQLIPIWENYYLHFLGVVTDLPQIQRYHYANYKRNIKRGIGVCGDAATVLSSILDRYQIPNRLASFKGGHVVVEYESENGQRHVMDADFGVELGASLDAITANPGSVRKAYADQGYSEREINTLESIYGSGYLIFNDTYHFMTKRYVFEEVSYVMKWLAPLFLIIVSVFYLIRTSRRKVEIDTHSG